MKKIYFVNYICLICGKKFYKKEGITDVKCPRCETGIVVSEEGAEG